MMANQNAINVPQENLVLALARAPVRHVHAEHILTRWGLRNVYHAMQGSIKHTPVEQVVRNVLKASMLLRKALASAKSVNAEHMLTKQGL
jgi:glucokinase